MTFNNNWFQSRLCPLFQTLFY